MHTLPDPLNSIPSPFFPIHETFQQTVQGEGFHAGRPADFIRLGGCPVRCFFCDTGYADGGKSIHYKKMTSDELVSELKSDFIVITGGEPFIHPKLGFLIEQIEKSGRSVAIETSGIRYLDIPPSAWVTLSPKQHVSPDSPVDERMWKRANEIKITVVDGSEVEYYNKYIYTEEKPLFLQPEWYTIDTSLKITLNLLKQLKGFRLSLQTHKYLGVP